MAPRRKKEDASDQGDVLKDLLITQLGLGGVPQQAIRQIVGCDINRVSRIVKHLKAVRRGTAQKK